MNNFDDVLARKFGEFWGCIIFAACMITVIIPIAVVLTGLLAVGCMSLQWVFG